MPPENQFQNQNQEVNSPKKKSPLIWAIVLIVILFGAGTIAGYLALNTERPVQVIEPQIEFEETTFDTSDWQTYRNEEFGFEVKYPDDFRVFDRQLNKSNVVNLPGSIGIVEFCPLSLGIRCDHPSGRPGIHLGISNQPTDIIFTNSEQSIRSIRYRDYIVNNIKHLDLNGITGFIIDADNNQGSRFINFVVVSENYIFTMFGWGNTEEERIDFGTKIFEVAPTFQFIQ